MKDNIFVDVNDGSTNKNLQVLINKDAFEKPGHGSSIFAKGILSQSPKGQLELKADDFQVISMDRTVLRLPTTHCLTDDFRPFQINAKSTNFHF